MSKMADKKLKLIAYVNAGYTQKAAAKLVGISENTACNWMAAAGGRPDAAWKAKLLKCISEGMSQKEAARKAGVSENTASTYMANLRTAPHTVTTLDADIARHYVGDFVAWMAKENEIMAPLIKSGFDKYMIDLVIRKK